MKNFVTSRYFQKETIPLVKLLAYPLGETKQDLNFLSKKIVIFTEADLGLLHLGCCSSPISASDLAICISVNVRFHITLQKIFYCCCYCCCCYYCYCCCFIVVIILVVVFIVVVLLMLLLLAFSQMHFCIWNCCRFYIHSPNSIICF